MATKAASLTPKQEQVLGLLREGKDVNAIAKKMRITPAGVYGHMRNIRKAGVELPNERHPNGGDGAVPALRITDSNAALPLASVIGGSPEESLTAAIEAGETRAAEINAEIDQLERRIAELGAERGTVEAHTAKYANALALLQD